MLPERPDSKSLRYAEWLPGARAPKTSVSVFFAAILLSVAYLMPVLLALLLPAKIAAVYISSLFAPLIVPAYALLIFWFVKDQKRQRSEIPIVDLPSSLVQHSVALTLHREVLYGIDLGRVSFVDNWLVYQGHGFSFSVRKSDVQIEDSSLPHLIFDGPLGPIKVKIVPREKGFQEDWHLWIRDRTEAPGTAILPPIVPVSNFKAGGTALGFALYLVIAGFITLWALPVLGAIDLIAAYLSLVIYEAKIDAIRRIRAGKPPRPNGLAAAFRALRSGEPVGTATRRLFAREKRPSSLEANP